MHRDHGSSELDKQFGTWALAGLFLTALLVASIFGGSASASEQSASQPPAIEGLSPAQAQD